MAIGCMPTSEEAQARTSKVPCRIRPLPTHAVCCIRRMQAIAVVLLQLLLGVAMLVTLTSNPVRAGAPVLAAVFFESLLYLGSARMAPTSSSLPAEWTLRGFWGSSSTFPPVWTRMLTRGIS